jgi:hypothetical protein
LQPRKRDDQRDEIQTDLPGANAKPGEQWEGAFDKDLGSHAYGQTGFEDVGIDDQAIEIYDEEDDEQEEENQG